MTPREMIAEFAPDALMLDEQFDHCILGTTTVDSEDVVAYSEDSVIEHLAKTMGDGAREYYEFNIAGARMECSPVFVAKVLAE